VTLKFLFRLQKSDVVIPRGFPRQVRTFASIKRRNWSWRVYSRGRRAECPYRPVMEFGFAFPCQGWSSRPAEPLARFYGPLKPRADQVTTSGADRLYREVLRGASWGWPSTSSPTRKRLSEGKFRRL